jgi:hypothetical protein
VSSTFFASVKNSVKIGRDMCNSKVCIAISSDLNWSHNARELPTRKVRRAVTGYHLPAATEVAQIEALLPWRLKPILDEQKKQQQQRSAA